MNITLIGMMGAGKSSVGRLLASRTGFNFTDTDELIVKQEGKSVNQIFEENGEQYFRMLETQVLQNVLNAQNQVISTGGGIVKFQKNIDLLKSNSTLIYLKADCQTLYNRVKNDKNRPLLNNSEDVCLKINTLLKERCVKYEMADIIIDTTEKSLQTIADEIIGKIK